MEDDAMNVNEGEEPSTTTSATTTTTTTTAAPTTSTTTTTAATATMDSDSTPSEAAPSTSSGGDDMRARILAINRDTSLTKEQKTRLIQDVMTAKFRAAQAVKEAEQSSTVKTEEQVIKTYHNASKGVLGCPHYILKCRVRAPCCTTFFGCRLCHDEKSTHKINRHAINEIQCMECGLEQPVAPACAQCALVFATYFCRICNFYDGDTTKDIYHCHKCGICRRGKGIDIDFFHCDKCAMCLSVSMRDHVCRENKMDQDCPVCSEHLFTSTHPSQVLPCGHLIHNDCMKDYVKRNFRCPLCQKSMFKDMSPYWRIMEGILESSPMPALFASAKAVVLCNDCEQRFTAPYHFEGFSKCAHCGGYNTRYLSKSGLPTADEFNAFIAAEQERAQAALVTLTADGSNNGAGEGEDGEGDDGLLDEMGWDGYEEGEDATTDDDGDDDNDSLGRGAAEEEEEDNVDGERRRGGGSDRDRAP